MGRRKSVYRPSKPRVFDHPVSAIFDEPYVTPNAAVVRWWYGDSFKEQRTASPWPGFVDLCKNRVRQNDLEMMEQRVWGCARTVDFNGMPPSPEFWKQVAESRDRNVR